VPDTSEYRFLKVLDAAPDAIELVAFARCQTLQRHGLNLAKLDTVLDDQT
jgi:hypothetical protein